MKKDLDTVYAAISARVHPIIVAVNDMEVSRFGEDWKGVKRKIGKIRTLVDEIEQLADEQLQPTSKEAD